MIRDQERGSVAVVTAVFLLVLVAMLAFTLDTSYLYVEKNRFQNAVEAAALAGAAHLCEDPRGIVLAMLQDTLFGGEWPEGVTPEDWVEVGYYDQNSGEFFSLEELGAGEYENAVKVTVSVQKQNLVPMAVGEDTVTLTASALAFKEPYGLLAKGKPTDAPDIKTQDAYPGGYPIFRDLGRIHANGDLRCVGTPQVTGDTKATASGVVVNLSSAHGDEVEVRDVRPLDWDVLRTEAESRGRVIHMSDFPVRDPSKPVDQDYQEYDGNRYYAVKTDGKGFALGLQTGDHGGAVYYISAAGPLAHSPEEYAISVTGISEEAGSQITNFVVASELPLTFDNPMGRHILGGHGDQIAYIYCKQNIGGSIPTWDNFLHDGVVYRAEKGFTARLPYYAPSTAETYRLRVIADGTILLYGGRYGMQAHPTTLDGNFGPPCGPGILHLVAPAAP